MDSFFNFATVFFKAYCVRMTHDPSKEAVDPVVVVAISYFINAKYTLLYK